MDSTDIIRATRSASSLLTETYQIITPQELSDAEKALVGCPKDKAVAHLLHMARRTETEWVMRDSLGKANRWLAFIQGWIWHDSIVSIHMEMSRNRPR